MAPGYYNRHLLEQADSPQQFDDPRIRRYLEQVLGIIGPHLAMDAELISAGRALLRSETVLQSDHDQPAEIIAFHERVLAYVQATLRICENGDMEQLFEPLRCAYACLFERCLWAIPAGSADDGTEHLRQWSALELRREKQRLSPEITGVLDLALDTGGVIILSIDMNGTFWSGGQEDSVHPLLERRFQQKLANFLRAAHSRGCRVSLVVNTAGPALMGSGLLSSLHQAVRLSGVDASVGMLGERGTVFISDDGTGGATRTVEFLLEGVEAAGSEAFMAFRQRALRAVPEALPDESRQASVVFRYNGKLPPGDWEQFCTDMESLPGSVLMSQAGAIPGETVTSSGIRHLGEIAQQCGIADDLVWYVLPGHKVIAIFPRSLDKASGLLRVAQMHYPGRAVFALHFDNDRGGDAAGPNGQVRTALSQTDFQVRHICVGEPSLVDCDQCTARRGIEGMTDTLISLTHHIREKDQMALSA